MIVVTGATGNVGRPLVRALAEAGERVTAVSRHAPDAALGGPADGGAASPAAADGGAAGVRHRPADLADPESLRPVLDGAEALFLLLGGELLAAGGNPRDLLDVVKAAGVARVVLMSSQAAGTRPASYGHSQLRAFEEAVTQSGVDWTILRPGGFDSNAFGWAETIRAQRMVAAPFGDVGLPFIDPADIAEVAAVVLRDGRHAGRTYELTGPEPVTARQRAAAIGDALGTPVRFVEQTRAQAREQLLRFMPGPLADGTLDILGEPMAVERRVSPDVERILGRPPRSFADWAARNVAAFR